MKSVLLMVVGPAVFVALGVFLLLMPDPDTKTVIAGALGVGFFGLCLVVGSWTLFTKPIILSVDGNGITSPRHGFEFDWHSVSGVYLVTQLAGRSKHTYLAVDGTPRVSRGYMRRLGKINARLVPIPPSASAGLVSWVIGTSPSVDEAVAAISTFAPQIPIRDHR